MSTQNGYILEIHCHNKLDTIFTIHVESHIVPRKDEILSPLGKGDSWGGYKMKVVDVYHYPVEGAVEVVCCTELDAPSRQRLLELGYTEKSTRRE